MAKGKQKEAQEEYPQERMSHTSSPLVAKCKKIGVGRVLLLFIRLLLLFPTQQQPAWKVMRTIFI
jgi:hypothetical protein